MSKPRKPLPRKPQQPPPPPVRLTRRGYAEGHHPTRRERVGYAPDKS